MYEKCKKCNGERIIVINFNRYMCDACRATGLDIMRNQSQTFLNDDDVAQLANYQKAKAITHESATAMPRLSLSKRGRPRKS